MAMYPHVFMVQYPHGTEKSLVHAHLIDNSDTRLVEVEMPGVGEQTFAEWLEKHKHLPPPMHSPAMLAHTNNKWRYRTFDEWRSFSPHRGRPVAVFREAYFRDDSSDDSFHSGVGFKSHIYTRTVSPPVGGNGNVRHSQGNFMRFQSPDLMRMQENREKRQNNAGNSRGRPRTFRSRNHPGNSNNSGHIPPDRFLGHGHLVHVEKTPSHIGSTDAISKSIWNMFILNQQTLETYRRKIHLWKDLFLFIRSSFPKFGLYLVGSTMSGMGTNSSDVDMCLLVKCQEMDQRNDALIHLGQIEYQLRLCNFASNVELIHAKVPILKFKSKGLEVDLNCNNSVGIRNTHLLYCYAQMDWRVRPLVVVVKLWASRHNINDAKRMTVSSYSWALMVIHFLQCGAKPAVVPCLQQEFAEKFLPHSDINHIDLHEEMPAWRSANKESLSQLLIGFLQYYKDFDYAEYAVSVRVADRIPIEECRQVRSYKNDPSQWKYLCIEEPFDLTNTARSVYDQCAFERVRRVVQASYERLKTTRRLDSLFERNFQPL